MKDHKTKTDSITRINLDAGNFATISNKIMLDVNLTSDAFRLITILLNNADSWQINAGYFARKIGWKDHKKLTAALKNLEANGYLSKQWNGKEWSYTINEYGTLSTGTIDVSDVKPTVSVSDPEPVIAIPLLTATADPETIENLVAFSNLYNATEYMAKAISPAFGRKVIVNHLIEKQLVTTREQIIDEYAK